MGSEWRMNATVLCMLNARKHEKIYIPVCTQASFQHCPDMESS